MRRSRILLSLSCLLSFALSDARDHRPSDHPRLQNVQVFSLTRRMDGDDFMLERRGKKSREKAERRAKQASTMNNPSTERKISQQDRPPSKKPVKQAPQVPRKDLKMIEHKPTIPFGHSKTRAPSLSDLMKPAHKGASYKVIKLPATRRLRRMYPQPPGLQSARKVETSLIKSRHANLLNGVQDRLAKAKPYIDGPMKWPVDKEFQKNNERTKVAARSGRAQTRLARADAIRTGLELGASHERTRKAMVAYKKQSDEAERLTKANSVFQSFASKSLAATSAAGQIPHHVKASARENHRGSILNDNLHATLSDWQANKAAEKLEKAQIDANPGQQGSSGKQARGADRKKSLKEQQEMRGVFEQSFEDWSRLKVIADQKAAKLAESREDLNVMKVAYPNSRSSSDADTDISGIDVRNY